MTRRGTGRRILMAAGTAVAAIVLVGIVQLRPPAWWPADPSALASDADAAATAGRFGQACVSEIYRVRGDEAPWAVLVREDDVNAWLATRFPKWCDHVGVARLADVRVRFGDGTVEVATELPDLPAVASVAFEPEVSGQWLRPNLGAVRVGRLPVPFLSESAVGAVVEALGDAGDDDLRGILLPLLRGKGVDCTFELADGRRVRLRDIEPRDGELRLELETLPRERK